jgi:predicted dienelactone hydrolase
MGRPVQRNSWIAIGLSAALLAACGSEATGGSPSSASADTTGADSSTAGDSSGQSGDATAIDSSNSDTSSAPTSYGIGVLNVETKGPGGRSLQITIWYPTDPGAKGEPAKYLLGQVPSPRGAQEQVAAAKGPFPLVAFSHGNSGVRDQSFFLCEELASRGYVVAAPDHTGNTFLDFDQSMLPAMAFLRPKDITATLDRVLTPQANDPSWLKGLVDESRIGVSGHSFGGYTSLAVAGAKLNPPKAYLPDCSNAKPDNVLCQEVQAAGPLPWDLSDKRVKVAVPLAHCLTAAFEPQSLAAMKGPVMLQAATGDKTCNPVTEAKATYKLLGSPKSLVMIQGGDHFSFANICDLMPLMPAAYKAQFDALCSGKIQPPIDTSLIMVSHYAAAAFDIYLRDRKELRSEFATGATGGMPVEVESDGVTAAQ